MDWRSKLGWAGSKKRVELTLAPDQLSKLARVCLDVQKRALDALGTSTSKGMQLRHELFMSWIVSYHVTMMPNGIEHHLSVNHDGSVPPEFREAIFKDALRLLCFCVRVSRLVTTSPFDVELSGVGVRRVLLPDQSKKLLRDPEQVPTSEALSAQWTAACSEATPLEGRLMEPFTSTTSGLRPVPR
ncbi:MAG: hypothetical protein INH41_05985 [Myxococcaceae bacterium]|jgi:hypothetical protein|nr:hypothetical protein [Myxococcaceae bacterium]MCA3011936.1 hypothetical protein [Myxococcaceae bacterium]